VEAAYPEARVELWSFDEHRLGLHPVLRRVWAPRGERPVVVVEPRFEWLYLYGFVQPQTGRTFFGCRPKVNAGLYSEVLAEFAGSVGAGKHRRVVLVVDGASWHRSKSVVVPEGIHIVFLPPYSPELQPAERLWPLTNEAVANRHFASLCDLEAAQQQRCQDLSQRPELVERMRSYTLFHWWPQISK
jgi:transposase